MGLHAHIHQVNRDVSIALCGEFRLPELAQLEAIISHYHGRGCLRFVLDLSRVAPLTPAAEALLHRLTGRPNPNCKRTLRSNAIRHLADTPAVQPQTGCGGLVFSAAS